MMIITIMIMIMIMITIITVNCNGVRNDQSLTINLHLLTVHPK